MLEGFWFKVGGWLAEVAITLSVLAVIVVAFFIAEWAKGRGKRS